MMEFLDWVAESFLISKLCSSFLVMRDQWCQWVGDLTGMTRKHLLIPDDVDAELTPKTRKFAHKLIDRLWSAWPQRDAYLKGKRIEQWRALATVELETALQTLPKDSLELTGVLVSNGKEYLTVGEAVQAEALLTEGLQVHQRLAHEA